MLFSYLDMFSCKVPSFSEPCDLLWKTEVYVETHLKILGVCDKRKIPTVTNKVFCSFLQDSAGVRLAQVAVCFFAFPYSQKIGTLKQWVDLILKGDESFFTATCRRPRSQWWAVAYESLLVYRLRLERCCAAAVTWPSVFSLIPILTFLAGGRGPSLVRLRLHSWDFQVSAFGRPVVCQPFKPLDRCHLWLSVPCYLVLHRFFAELLCSSLLSWNVWFIQGLVTVY